MQADWSPLATWPPVHAVQEVAPAEETLPEAQATQGWLAIREPLPAVPAGQVAQARVPLSPPWPAGQVAAGGGGARGEGEVGGAAWRLGSMAAAPRAAAGGRDSWAAGTARAAPKTRPRRCRALTVAARGMGAVRDLDAWASGARRGAVAGDRVAAAGDTRLRERQAAAPGAGRAGNAAFEGGQGRRRGGAAHNEGAGGAALAVGADVGSDCGGRAGGRGSAGGKGRKRGTRRRGGLTAVPFGAAQGRLQAANAQTHGS
jgi:hypothetical protein